MEDDHYERVRSGIHRILDEAKRQRGAEETDADTPRGDIQLSNLSNSVVVIADRPSELMDRLSELWKGGGSG